MKRRHIFASRETSDRIKLLKTKKIAIYSFFPIDPFECECRDLIDVFKRQLGEMSAKDREAKIAEMGTFVCPRDKTGMQRFELSCANCGQVQGYAWAKDASLTDWSDFHYTNWTDGNEWFGCLTPNISPITGELGLECTCGADTRDFRANMTISPKEAFEIEDKNKEGRKFGSKGAKFTARKVRANIKPAFELGNLKSIEVDRPGK